MVGVARHALPAPDEGEFYHADLIGLQAVGQDGALLGTVVAVENFGAGDLIEIAPEDGPSRLVPFTRAAVPDIDVAGGRLVVAPPEEITIPEEDEP
jgi:16S rRNA processing protein RimM